MAGTNSRENRDAQGAKNGPLSALSLFESATFGRLTSGMNAVGGIWIVLLVLLVVGDVVGREAFNNPITATKEMVQLSIPGIVFLLPVVVDFENHVTTCPRGFGGSTLSSVWIV